MNRRTIISTALAAAVLVISIPERASGQYTSAMQLSKVSAIHVYVEDSVDADDCLSNPDTLQTEAELVLRRSGIAVTYGLDSHSFSISIVGYQTRSSLCVVSYRVQLWKSEVLRDTTIGIVESFSRSGVMTGPHTDMQDRLRSRVNEYTTELANEILKARQD